MKATRTKSSKNALLPHTAKQKASSLKRDGNQVPSQMSEKELFFAHSKQTMTKYISKYLTE